MLPHGTLLPPWVRNPYLKKKSPLNPMLSSLSPPPPCLLLLPVIPVTVLPQSDFQLTKAT